MLMNPVHINILVFMVFIGGFKSDLMQVLCDHEHILLLKDFANLYHYPLMMTINLLKVPCEWCFFLDFILIEISCT